MIEDKKHIFKIDILRGIAIIAVFLFHVQLALFPDGIKKYGTNNFIESVTLESFILNFSPVAFGWSGVQLFLLISGFLIHLGFLYKKEVIEISTFYSKRFWRIYPPYLLILIFFCLPENGIDFYFFTFKGLMLFFSHVFLVYNLYDYTFFGINASFWSLALEIQLYLIYPLLLLTRKKIGIERTLLLLVLLSFSLLIIGFFIGRIGTGIAYNSSVFKYWFIWCAGAYLAEKYFNNKKIIKRGAPIIISIGFILTILSKIHLYTSYATIYLATFTLLIFFEWFLTTEKMNSKTLLGTIISTIGICSYSFYLIHQPYLPDMFNFFQVAFKTQTYLTPYVIFIEVFLVFGIIFLISYLLYLFIELPSVKFGNELRGRINKSR